MANTHDQGVFPDGALGTSSSVPPISSGANAPPQDASILNWKDSSDEKRKENVVLLTSKISLNTNNIFNIVYFRNIFSAFRSPETNRLLTALRLNEIEIQQVTSTIQDEKNIDRHRHGMAQAYMKAAWDSFQKADYENAWAAEQEASRVLLSIERNQRQLKLVATMMRREANSKLSGWRLKAFEDIMYDEKGKLREEIERNNERLVNAAYLLDDHFNTVRHRILLRRKHLMNVFLVIILALSGILMLSYFKLLEGALVTPAALASAMLLGALGASLSVAHAMMRADLDARIPRQMVGAFSIWIRPAVGAAAACACLFLLQVGKFAVVSVTDANLPLLAYVVAFLSGFSERFFIGGIERLSNDSKGTN